MSVNYDVLSDDDLIEKIRNSDNDALNFLLNKYKPLVKIKARMFFLIGGDTDDLIQEGMIGLFSAVKKYEKSSNNSFKTFAEVCISNQIKSALRNNNRLKHSSLNDSVSLESLEIEFSIDTDTPLNKLISREDFINLTGKINELLTDFEKKVLILYLNGYKRTQIAHKLKKDNKSISNCLSRIKKKTMRLENERFNED